MDKKQLYSRIKQTKHQIMLQKVNVPLDPQQSFSLRIDYSPRLHNLWHYHHEVECIFILKGKGTHYIGDSVKNFGPGDLILVKDQTPHYWSFDEEFIGKDEDKLIEVYALHFSPELLGEGFFKLPEHTIVNRLFKDLAYNLTIHPELTPTTKIFNDIHMGPNSYRVMKLLELLLHLGSLPNEKLCSQHYVFGRQKKEQKRISNIIEYLRLNYKRRLTLNEISNFAGMTPNSFCRFFKSNTGKTFIEFINLMRIQYAEKLLKETELSIKEIAYEAGFSNPVNFHKVFKKTYNQSPMNYKKQTGHPH